MSIWFFLWLVLSALLLYFLGWTLYILVRQKQAWKAYAAKKQLRYKSHHIFSSPEVIGTVDGYTVHMLTGEHATKDGRNFRKLTAIEVNLLSHPPVDMVAASGGMVDIAHEMGFKEEFRPDIPGWSEQYLAASASIPALKTYLTPARIDALTSLMKIKNSWVILIFKSDYSFLRFDSPAALDDARKIDLLVNKLVKTANILELRPGEDQVLKIEAAKTTKEKTIFVSDSETAAVNLELEQDEGEKNEQ